MARRGMRDDSSGLQFSLPFEAEHEVQAPGPGAVPAAPVRANGGEAAARPLPGAWAPPAVARPVAGGAMAHLAAGVSVDTLAARGAAARLAAEVAAPGPAAGVPVPGSAGEVPPVRQPAAGTLPGPRPAAEGVPIPRPAAGAAPIPRPAAGVGAVAGAAVLPVAPPPRPHPLERLLRHPRGNREVRLGGHLVAYELRRARRRTIGFVVADDGLAVSAPRWVPLAEIESALQEKSSWILRKLQEQGERLQRLEARRIEWRDGTGVPFLGETVIVVLDPRIAGARLNTAATEAAAVQAPLAGVPRLTLHVGLPQQAEPAQIRDAVQSWLQRQARRVFEERCHHFAPRLGVQVRRLSLSSAQTRWGSASADGTIRLNWRLVHFAMPTIDYVVAHELAHLRVMDHSPRFWDVVRSVLPDYEQARGRLRDDVLPVMD